MIQNRGAYNAYLGGLALASLAVAGCSDEFQTTYGQRTGPGASLSVNGTSVLGGMFEKAGHTVYSRHLLSPRLRQRADCIVWFPDDFRPPNEDVCHWLDEWLSERPPRTLIYVGRDFDAAGWYWEKVLAGAAPGQARQISSRADVARRAFQGARRSSISGTEECPWFVVDAEDRPRGENVLQGPWSAGIDPAKVEIRLSGRLAPDRSAEVWLESKDDVLVSATRVDGSRRIVVANGSFLLNLPLVNHEHRKLAGKLIAAVGAPPQTVVFLESGAGGPEIVDTDPSSSVPTGLEILATEPINWIFVHLAVVGIAFCFLRWPLFGLPRDLPRDRTSDFGKHVEALGRLLQRSRDRAYAVARLLHYQQTARPKD